MVRPHQRRAPARRWPRTPKANGFGKSAITFRIKDWGISRQRYWGTPIPVIHCPKCGTGPGAGERPAGRAAAGCRDHRQRRIAARSVASFVNVPCPEVRRHPRGAKPTPWTRSWIHPGIFIATAIPQNDRAPFDPAKIAYWFPIDQYIGGVDTCDSAPDLFALLDQGHARHRRRLKTGEPVKSLFTQGMVLKDGVKPCRSPKATSSIPTK